MNGLIVVGTALVGGVVGFWGGMVAAMFWADMDLASMDAVAYIGGGTFIGTAAGAYVGGQLVS